MPSTAASSPDAAAAVRARTFIGGEWRDTRTYRAITDPYRGQIVGKVAIADHANLDAAIFAAVAAKQAAAALPGYQRAALLHRVACLLEERADEIASLMAREMGKARKGAEGEVRRSKDTISLSAQEAIRIGREGPRYAIREMTDERLALFNL